MQPKQSFVARIFYHDKRPTRLGRIANRIQDWWAAAGLPPSYQVSLETTGRVTGMRHSNPVAIPEVGGNRYLVSMLGDRSQWVKNVRAHPDALLRHGRNVEAVLLTEVPTADRPPILKEYVRIAPGGRRHFPVTKESPVSAFAPIAHLYPVFRIEPR